MATDNHLRNEDIFSKTPKKAIAELSEVAGGSSVSYIQIAPRNIIARLTLCRVSGYDTYGFNEDGEFTGLNQFIDRELLTVQA